MGEGRNLSWRERQVMDVLWRLGEASVEQVREEIPDALSYSTVRTLLGRMEKKGHVTHHEQGVKYIYEPVQSRSEARESAASRLLRVFCDGSVAEAVTGLVGALDDELSDEELAEIERAVLAAKARRQEDDR